MHSRTCGKLKKSLHLSAMKMHCSERESACVCIRDYSEYSEKAKEREKEREEGKKNKAPEIAPAYAREEKRRKRRNLVDFFPLRRFTSCYPLSYVGTSYFLSDFSSDSLHLPFSLFHLWNSGISDPRRDIFIMMRAVTIHSTCLDSVVASPTRSE